MVLCLAGTRSCSYIGMRQSLREIHYVNAARMAPDDHWKDQPQVVMPDHVMHVQAQS